MEADKEEKQDELTEQKPVSESARQDAEWVLDALAGNENVYKLIVNKYEKALYFFIIKMIRDREIIPDLIQEIFTKAFSNLESYNSQFAFSTWLYRIATNHTIDYLRKKKLQTLSIDEPVSTKDGDMQMELPDTSFEADKSVIQQQRKKIIDKAIEELPEKYRMVIQMRHMEEKSYQEISDILDLPLGTVKAHIFRARELLYKYLKDKQDTF